MKRLFISLFVATACLFLLPIPRVNAAVYSKLWEAQLPGAIGPTSFRSAPIIDANGNIYAATSDLVVSYDRDGNKRWDFSGRYAWPQLVLAEGKIITITNNYGVLSVLNAVSGQVLWETSVNPDGMTAVMATPKVLNGRIYVSYERSIPTAQAKFKAYDLATGALVADNATNPPAQVLNDLWGIPCTDFALPHLATSSAQIFVTTYQGVLLSLTRARLSASVDKSGLSPTAPPPTLTDDDSRLILLGYGNILNYYRIKTDGEEYASPEFSVDLGAAPQTKAVVFGDLILVSVGQPAELVAVSISSKRVAWRRALNSDYSSLPVKLSDSVVAIMADSLHLIELETGAVVQEIAQEASSWLYYSGAGVGEGRIYFISKNAKLTAYGIAAPPAPKHHPVIFIHGLGGNPADWEVGGNKEDYKIKLWDKYSTNDLAYSQDWFLSYSYTGTDAKTSGYNNQGTIEDVSLGMEQAVATLSASHKAAGGDGQVDLLGYSLGGLVIREYLAAHPNNHNIHQAVTIASPHQGAYFADIRKAADAFGLIPSVKNYVISLMQAIGGVAHTNIDPGRPVVEELYPDSTYIGSLKSKDISSPPVFDVIAGSINVKFRQSLFNKDFVYTPLDVGDLVISEQSATTITPLTPSHIVPFSQDLIVPIRFSREAGSVGLDISVPTTDALKYYHLSITQQPDVIGRTVELLDGGVI